MQDIGLSEDELSQISKVFERVEEIKEVILFGSRAKGNFRNGSDVDLAVVGLETNFQVQKVADELDQLPLPYTFDVKALELVQYQPLREHIERAGITLYTRDCSVGWACSRTNVGLLEKSAEAVEKPR